MPRLPSLTDLSPTNLSRARTRALARARRASVKLLTSASSVPGVRPVTELAFRRLFDSLAGNWDAIRADPTYRDGFVEALGHLPRGFRPRRALDVACGTGIATAAIADRWPGVAVIGTDIAPRMVERARDAVPEATFQVASVHRLPFADGEFDLVTALDGMLDERELLRVLHRRGRLLIVFSQGGTTPIARPLDALAERFAELDATSVAHVDGQAHVLVVRHRR